MHSGLYSITSYHPSPYIFIYVPEIAGQHKQIALLKWSERGRERRERPRDGDWRSKKERAKE